MFREEFNMQPVSIMNHYFLLKLQLYCKGRAIFDQSRRDYPLHKAVFENNLPLISRLVKCQHEGTFFAEKNEIDAGGNTPLMLAVKLGNIDAVKVLTDLFTCPKMKSFPSCMHPFILLKLLNSSMCIGCGKCHEAEGSHSNPAWSKLEDKVALPRSAQRSKILT